MLASSPSRDFNPFETLSVYTTFIIFTSGQEEYFIVAVDYFIKWEKVQSARKDTSHAAAMMLHHSNIFYHGFLENLLINNCLLFNTKALRAKCARWWNHRHISSACHAATNGLAKRTIGNLKKVKENSSMAI